MNQRAQDGGGSFAPFPTTSWTLIRQAQGAETTIRQASLDQLVRQYWKPLYAYYRSKRQSQQDAQDLVQECLWSPSQDGLSQLKQGEQKFHRWLMTCARNLMVDWIRRKNAKRRRMLEGAVSFERMAAEDGDPFEPTGGEHPERAFRDAWRRSILERAMNEVRQLCLEKNRADDFEVFVDYYVSSRPEASLNETPPTNELFGHAAALDVPSENNGPT